MPKRKGGTNRRHKVVVDRRVTIVSPTNPARRYVNLPPGPPKRGRDVTVTAEVRPAQAGVTIHWTLEARPANRAGLADGVKAGLLAVGAPGGAVPAATLTSLTDAHGRTQVVLRLSLYGGDEFRAAAGFAANNLTTRSGWLTVWRRLWYQVTRDPVVAIPSLAPMEAAFKRVFVLIDRYGNEVPYIQFWLDGLSTNHYNYYPLQMVQPGASVNLPVPVIGNFNKRTFAPLFAADGGTERQGRKAHVIVVGAQYDLNDEVFSFKGEVTANPCELRMPRAVLNPALDQGLSWFVQGWFKPSAQWGGWRTLAATDVLFPANRGAAATVPSHRPRYIQVQLPLLATDPVPSAAAPYVVSLRLIGANGPYKGESFGAGATMNVCSAEYSNGFPLTVAHEIGHAVNQSPIKDDRKWSAAHPAGFGLPNHPHAYRGRGGQGEHCHSVHNGGVDEPGVLIKTGLMTWEYDGSSGTCIMFHKSHAGCRGEFCSVCEPYLRAEPMTQLT
jgi:hypothetical protein